MTMPFKHLKGIEYLRYLHDLGLDILKVYKEKYAEFLTNYGDLLTVSEPGTFELINGDFFKEDWSTATFVLINSTCFPSEMMEQIAEKMDEVQLGCIVVTFTKKLSKLNSQKWRILNGFKRNMSWGIATIFLHQKIAK